MPYSRSQVAQKREQEKETVEAKDRITEVTKWLRLVADDQPYHPPADAEQIKQLMANKVLFGDQAPTDQLATAIAQNANFHRPEAIFETLVKLGYWTTDQNLDLLRTRSKSSLPHLYFWPKPNRLPGGK